MRHGIYIICLCLLFAGFLTATQDGIEIRSSGSDFFETEPGISITIPLDVTNRTADGLDLIPRIDIPDDWDIINGIFPFKLGAGESDLRLLSFHIPLRAPAGKLWHHAYIGGLSEHSANLAELALRVSIGYDFLNKDILIFGGLFHDIGKMDSYTTDMVIDFTDEGRLIDHICIADSWIVEHAKQIENFPDRLLMKLRHIILSHQGEYSTPVVPKIPEAFVIYYCDEIDSKMGGLERIRDRQGGKGWSEYIKLLGRYVYFGFLLCCGGQLYRRTGRGIQQSCIGHDHLYRADYGRPAAGPGLYRHGRHAGYVRRGGRRLLCRLHLR